MNRHICIHGHFYQPPRENPWLEVIETQDSAYPYHDWNERINTECYEPNSITRILDEKGKITQIVNNYEKISFNFGPTLLNWMEEHSPDVYRAIQEADRISSEKRGGHGNAIAQAYNHMIMPLANKHDKTTQIVWGIKDFTHRFSRRPEGMWLPETAVDVETLSIMREHDIRFVILAPRQARKVRPIGHESWHDVSNGSIDTTMPYTLKLPSGQEIGIFFYDGGISHNIAFGDLLNKGENLANSLMAAAHNKKNVPHLVHVATDGETFGHHHKFGEMALAYGMDYIESRGLAKITNYGEYLDLFPPTHEVELFENSSWSCVHGIERWRNNCGCNSGMSHGWTQTWRKPLRKAMDWLRDALMNVYEREAASYFPDPWETRDRYIDVILDRSREKVERFFEIHAQRGLSREEKVRALKLLEMQRNTMLMYTSCGWFFDEVSGVENIQVMQYASKAIQYGAEIQGSSLQSEYVQHLKKTPSNKFENAARVYEKYVKPAECDLLRVGAHYCMSSIFEEYTDETKICCYTAKSKSYEQIEAGKLKAALGKTEIISDITWDNMTISFAVLHFGDQNINAGVRNVIADADFSTMTDEIKDAFVKGNIPGVVRLMDTHFGNNIYSLWHLFKDEQKKVLDQVLQITYEGVESAYRQIYENNFTIMNFYDSLQHQIPRPFLAAAEYVVNTDLKKIFDEESVDIVKLKRLIDETQQWSIGIDTTTIAFKVSSWIRSGMGKLAEDPEHIQLIEKIIDVMEVITPLSLPLNMWKSQNIYFSIGESFLASIKDKAGNGDKRAEIWINRFSKLGQYLKVTL